MSTSNCQDLCTAAKCEELENRIELLEQDLALLLAAFNSHVEQEIPEAHQYKPEVTVGVAIGEGDLIVDVTVDGQSDFSAVPLPNFEPFVTFDIFPTGQNIYEFVVSVNGDSDSDILDLSNQDNLDVYVGYNSQNQIEVLVQLGEQEAYSAATLPNSNVSVDFFNNDENGALLKVQVGNNSDEDYIRFPEINTEKHIVSNLKLDGSYQNDILTLTVADGESFDTAQIFIDAGVINNYGGGSNVSCDELSQEFQDCCSQILAAVAANLSKIQLVEQAVTIDISGTVETELTCVAEEETKSSQSVETIYQGVGLAGIHENLKLVSTNIVNLHKEICEANNDVVAIVASDKVLDRHQGKTLMLHLVTAENYPKRSRDSSYWTQQIPEARESYEWNEDFLELRQQRGNLYAELYFVGIKDPVSGWFADKAAANSWFDAILTLTTAQERNRKYHEQLTPARSITPNTVRPYRAFITSVSDAGRGVCEVKYVPPVENE